MNTACGIGALSYFFEYHIFAVHCGWKVPRGVGNSAVPDETGHVYLTEPYSETVMRCVLRSMATFMVGAGGGAGFAGAALSADLAGSPVAGVLGVDVLGVAAPDVEVLGAGVSLLGAG